MKSLEASRRKPRKGADRFPGFRTKFASFLGLLLCVLPAWNSPAAGQSQTLGPVNPAQKEKLESAIKQFSALVREHPESAKLWSNLGAVRAMSGQCKEALKPLDRARTLDPQLFVPWYFSGWCHLVFHKDRKALADLKRATGLNPKDSNAWYLRAQAAGNLGDSSASLAAVIRSLELNPERPEAYYLAGKDALNLATASYHKLSSSAHPGHYALLLDGERNAAQGVLELSINDYLKAQRQAPGDRPLQFALATAYLQAGKYGEAEELFRELLKAFPNAQWVKARLALALAMESRNQEANDLLETLPVDTLNEAVILNDYIACAMRLGLDKRAREAIARGGRLFPQDTAWKHRTQQPDNPFSSAAQAGNSRDLTGVGLSVRFLLLTESHGKNCVRDLFGSDGSFETFRVSFLASKWIKAGSALVPILKKWPEDQAHLFMLSETLHSMAYGFYEHLATAYPDSPATMLLAADNFSAMGNQAKALEIYQAMLDSNGPNPVLLRSVARIYWIQHDWTRASEALKRLERLDPNDATVFVNLGRIDSYEQNVDGAETNFRRAIQIDPTVFEAHLGLAEALRRKDHLDAAVEELHTAARLDPSNPRVHYELAQIYRRQGNKGLAGQEMARFAQLQRVRHETSEVNTNLVPLN